MNILVVSGIKIEEFIEFVEFVGLVGLKLL